MSRSKEMDFSAWSQKEKHEAIAAGVQMYAKEFAGEVAPPRDVTGDRPHLEVYYAMRERLESVLGYDEGDDGDDVIHRMANELWQAAREEYNATRDDFKEADQAGAGAPGGA